MATRNTLLFVLSPTFPHFSKRPSHVQRRRPPHASLKLTPQQQKLVSAIAIPSLPILAYSELTLLRTGCGLPAGPYGLIGAAEGVSYLVISAIVILSLYSKFSTRTETANKEEGNIISFIEAVSLFLAVSGLAIAAYTAVIYGGLPNAVPGVGSRCFPIEQ